MGRKLSLLALVCFGLGAAALFGFERLRLQDDRGALQADLSGVFSQASVEIVETETPVDDDWLDGLMTSMLSDGVDSARHGGLFRSLSGPFAGASIVTFALEEDDPRLERYVPLAQFFVVDGRAKLAIIEGQLGNLNGQEPETNLAYLQAASEALGLIAGAEPEPGLIEALIVEAMAGEMVEAVGTSFVTGSFERIEGETATFVFVEHFRDGAESPRVIVARSVMADRCAPMTEETNFYARYLCEAGMGEAGP